MPGVAVIQISQHSLLQRKFFKYIIKFIGLSESSVFRSIRVRLLKNLRNDWYRISPVNYTVRISRTSFFHSTQIYEDKAIPVTIHKLQKIVNFITLYIMLGVKLIGKIILVLSKPDLGFFLVFAALLFLLLLFSWECNLSPECLRKKLPAIDEHNYWSVWATPKTIEDRAVSWIWLFYCCCYFILCERCWKFCFLSGQDGFHVA